MAGFISPLRRLHVIAAALDLSGERRQSLYRQGRDGDPQ